jgi:hypothetical protein
VSACACLPALAILDQSAALRQQAAKRPHFTARDVDRMRRHSGLQTPRDPVGVALVGLFARRGDHP